MHCEGVRPGKARVFTCLLAHIESADYSAACREQLGAQQERRVRDWRLDYDLRTACRNDVPKVTLPPAAVMWLAPPAYYLVHGSLTLCACQCCWYCRPSTPRSSMT